MAPALAHATRSANNSEASTVAMGEAADDKATAAVRVARWMHMICSPV